MIDSPAFSASVIGPAPTSTGPNTASTMHALNTKLGMVTASAARCTPYSQLSATLLSPDSHLNGHKPAKLKYSIHSYSSAAPAYPPQHILVNNPTDQASRWTSVASDQSQFLTLALQQPAILTHLLFGKFHKPHVCNLKEFRVFAGMSPDADKMIEVLPFPSSMSGSFRTRVSSASFPTQSGTLKCTAWPTPRSTRSKKTIRAVLKYFRQRNFARAFAALSQDAGAAFGGGPGHAGFGAVLEDPLLSQLHERVVVARDYSGAEQMIRGAAAQGMLDEFVASAPWAPVWSPLSPLGGGSGIVGEQRPGPRGGHQMFMDSERGIVYLYGGWDGSRDLGDLWAYSVAGNVWSLISSNTQMNGGPSPRSCHKVCVDSQGRCAYVLGRYVDPTANGQQLDDKGAAEAGLASDFWRLDLNTLEWRRLSSNTANEGGPSLVYDHQMAMDSERGIVNDSSAQELKPRVSHAMIFHPPTRQLLILGGQRTSKETFNHFLAYDTVRGRIAKLPSSGAPDTGLTQRAVYDPISNSVLILSNVVQRPASHTAASGAATATNHGGVGISLSAAAVAAVSGIISPTTASAFSNLVSPIPNHPSSTSPTRHSAPSPTSPHGPMSPSGGASASGAAAATGTTPALWVYKLSEGTWHKRVFLFGGNPDIREAASARLDDFWELRLHRPSVEDVVRECSFMLRRQQFLSLANQGTDPIRALQYLQTEVAGVVDHSRPEEVQALAGLSMRLFMSPSSPTPMPRSSSQDMMMVEDSQQPHVDQGEDGFEARSALYDRLAGFFPKGMKQPEGSLTDYVPFV
ncbi:Muskelin N-terminus-domain-containing protein [Catenaria anguillulae PL171]|uniref:Muskelin N-terminus-domain-containing protein n=1 Tax=Catenaria anguillulae PL171 TaxID=765915 RepID=A0A1Y2HHQ0_9FUNG|nr:Muskelin N-terminus-domain-containing protein [Catenaria anguillulae PL171]